MRGLVSVQTEKEDCCGVGRTAHACKIKWLNKAQWHLIVFKQLNKVLCRPPTQQEVKEVFTQSRGDSDTTQEKPFQLWRCPSSGVGFPDRLCSLQPFMKFHGIKTLVSYSELTAWRCFEPETGLDNLPRSLLIWVALILPELQSSEQTLFTDDSGAALNAYQEGQGLCFTLGFCFVWGLVVYLGGFVWFFFPVGIKSK